MNALTLTDCEPAPRSDNYFEATTLLSVITPILSIENISSKRIKMSECVYSRRCLEACISVEILFFGARYVGLVEQIKSSCN